MANTTRLQAVNLILRALGESPVTSIPPAVLTETYNGVKDALDQAVRVLLVKREWPWASPGRFEEPWEIASVAGQVALPAGTVRVALHSDDTDYDRKRNVVVERGGYLYDVELQADNQWSGTKKLRLTIETDFETLPEAARQWCIARAKWLAFQSGQRPQTMMVDAKREEMEAWRALETDANARQRRSTMDDMYARYGIPRMQFLHRTPGGNR